MKKSIVLSLIFVFLAMASVAKATTTELNFYTKPSVSIETNGLTTISFKSETVPKGDTDPTDPVSGGIIVANRAAEGEAVWFLIADNQSFNVSGKADIWYARAYKTTIGLIIGDFEGLPTINPEKAVEEFNPSPDKIDIYSDVYSQLTVPAPTIDTKKGGVWIMKDGSPSPSFCQKADRLKVVFSGTSALGYSLYNTEENWKFFIALPEKGYSSSASFFLIVNVDGYVITSNSRTIQIFQSN